jgi:hypothetical protein
MNIRERIVNRLFGEQINQQVDFAVRCLDDSRDHLLGRSTFPRDRHGYDRDEVLADALEAWRVNPLARRVVELTSQYVVGGGLGVEAKHNKTNDFLQEWWKHRLNRMSVRVFEWCDELSRSGELFLVVSTDPAGMSYLRAVPAADIQEIITTDNDLEQEVEIYEKPNYDLVEGEESERTMGEDGLLRGRKWKVYNEIEDSRSESGVFEPVMLHYAVNRPVGGKHGESDLAPLLRWLSRYAAWLEDRARLNRYRQSFLYTVTSKFVNEAERQRRQAELNANPPSPGSILVIDESEIWNVLSPNLSSFEAAEDGLALKKMVAVGSGNPLHFLAEPESATRTTAESAGGPTFRHYQQRQIFFLWLIEDIIRVVIRRRKLVESGIDVDTELKVTGTDISARDNAALATAASTIVGAFSELRDRGLIDDNELLRISYRFASEVIDIEDMLARGAAAPTLTPALPRNGGGGEDKKKNGKGGSRKPPPAGRPAGVKIDPITGKPKGIDEI